MTKILSREGTEALIDFLENLEADFTAVVTNYTTTIDYEGERAKYMKDSHTKQTFSAFSKIKSDVSKHKVPLITEDSVSYFHHDINESFKFDKAIQIDVTKAYATVLLKMGVITEKTYDYLSLLNKKERLVAVGMLSSLRHTFKYKKGVIDDYQYLRSPLSGFFFACVQEIQELMNHCRMASGKDYIMTWVDSIYIQDNHNSLVEIIRTFENNGFGCSVHKLTDFKCIVMDSNIHISLYEAGDFKSFNIPNKTNVLASHFFNYITRRNAAKRRNDSNNKA